MNSSEVNNAGSRERILVVEDEEMLRMLIEEVLSTFGYHVHAAGNGEEALQTWHQHGGRFDLLLTDMVLPDGFNGRQIAAQLKAEQSNLKVVYASGFTSDLLDGSQGELVEGVNFLQKPYTTQTLANTVRQCLAA
jgi:CheY-like chemotaxis protein